jgi:hypothetical protein
MSLAPGKARRAVTTTSPSSTGPKFRVKPKARARSEPFFNETWWPLEVAIVWFATGDPALCQLATQFVADRRTPRQAKYPPLAIWLMTSQGASASYETTPGAIYRKDIHKNWKPGSGHLHPLDRAFAETAKILRGPPTGAIKRARGRSAARLAESAQTVRLEKPRRSYASVLWRAVADLARCSRCELAAAAPIVDA